MTATETAQETQRRARRLTGVVTSESMQDTVVVAVSRFVKHPKYRKFIKRTKKYHAHDPGNTKHVGDTVTIEECRPISKMKSFKVVGSET